MSDTDPDSVANFRQRRDVLEHRRACETFKLQFGNLDTTFHVTVGYYAPPNIRIGEIFISGAKAGSEVEAIARDGAVLLSLALQYGVPLDVIRHSLTRNEDNTPSTIIGAVVDHICKSGADE